MDFLSIQPERQRFASLKSLIDNLPTFFREKDFVCIDLQYLWRSTFKGDLLEKIKSIEFLDKQFIHPLKAYCKKCKVRLSLFPLKHTSIGSGKHLNGWVPAVSYPTVDLRYNLAHKFSEAAFEEIIKVIDFEDFFTLVNK